MQLKSLLCLSIAGVFLAAAATATADPGKRGHWIDRNGDGRIDREEAVLSPRLAIQFSLIDSNGDGYLDADELRAHRAAVKQAREDASAALFMLLDRDGNGRIEGDELADRPRLARLDLNGDGAVDVEEWAQRGAWMKNRGGRGKHR